jgi:outer membrane protein
MKMIKQLFIGLALMITTFTSAQSSFKFGHINTQAIFSVMPELKTVDEQLQAEYSTLEKQLTDMQEALKTLQTDYLTKLQANQLSPEERNSLETQIQQGDQKVQAFYQNSQQSLQRKEQELKSPIFIKVSDAIQAVGEENGFLYIFEEVGGLTLYKSEKSVDVAPLVKAKLGIQ